MISVNIGDKLKNELEYEDIKDHHWTDSKFILGFISNESCHFHTYIANRLQLIHERSHHPFTMAPCEESALNTTDEELPKGFMGSKGLHGEIRMDQWSWLPERTCRELADNKEAWETRRTEDADLPKLCIEPAPPFTYCGVDFFGPWHVQQGRAVMKRYGGCNSLSVWT